MKNDNSYQCSEAERQAINSPVQSFASDMTLMAAIEIHNTISSKSCRIVGTVHDSLLIEVRKDKIMRVATKVKAIMEHPKLMDEFQVELSVPIIAEIEVGPWSKGEKIHFKKLP
jgi:DNA polymerase-1